MTYDNNNTGTLFKNDRRTEQKHPEYKGSATIDGVEYWVSAWVKTAGERSKSPGSKFFSLSFQPKDGQAPQRKPSSPPAPPQEEDVPF